MKDVAVRAKFYARPTEEVARGLLGRILISDVGGRRTAGRIVEVEAYVGPHDPACHAYRHRRTARTEPLYGPPGTAYVYFTYGMHWCANVVCDEDGIGTAVLLRALQPVEGVDAMRSARPGARRDHDLCSGPARLCQALGIDLRLDGVDLLAGAPTESRLYLLARAMEPRICVSTRIGITRARDARLRFFVKDNPWVSR